MSDSESSGPKSRTAEKILLADERVIRELRPAWSAYAIPLLLLGFTVLGGLLTTVLASSSSSTNDAGPLLFVFTVLLGGAGFVVVYMARMQTRYIITNERVLKVTGLVNKTTHTMWLEDITAIKTTQSAFQRSRGYGSVTMARKPISRLQRIPLLPVGNGITFGAVPEIYDVAKVIEAGSVHA